MVIVKRLSIRVDEYMSLSIFLISFYQTYLIGFLKPKGSANREVNLTHILITHTLINFNDGGRLHHVRGHEQVPLQKLPLHL
jgi:hypothetical protein